jgi:hypothetical protein
VGGCARAGRLGRQVRSATARRGDRRAASGSPGPRVAGALRDLDEVFGELGVLYFLVDRTFLGVVRAGTVTGGHGGIDIGVFRDEIDLAALETAVRARDTFSIRRLDQSTDRHPKNHRAGVKIEVFHHYEQHRRIWHDGAATRWSHSPFELEEVVSLDVGALVPADADRYLTESFGDWRRTGPDFDGRLDAPNVEIADPAADYRQWPFDQPFHLVMNVAVGGNWGGAHGVDPDIWPQRMEVDYVRVYSSSP